MRCFQIVRPEHYCAWHGRDGELESEVGQAVGF